MALAELLLLFMKENELYFGRPQRHHFVLAAIYCYASLITSLWFSAKPRHSGSVVAIKAAMSVSASSSKAKNERKNYFCSLSPTCTLG